MNTMKRCHTLLLLITCAGLFAGCHNQKNGGAGGDAPKKLRLVFVGSTPDDYWSLVRLGCDFATRQLGDVDLDFRFPASRTVLAQAEVLTNLEAGAVDGVAISPIDAQDQTKLLNHLATNTLLVCADSDAESSQRVCYIGTDNLTAGKQAAELLKRALPQGGKVLLLVGYANAQNTKDRVAGLESGLAGSNVRIVGILADGGQSALATKNAVDALTANPDLAALVGIYGYHGPAILTAVRGAGKAGQVKIVCFDEHSETLDGIAAGDIYGTVVQKPLEIGWQTVVRMDKYLRGDKTQLAGGKILIGSRALTRDEIAPFEEERKGLLLRLKNEQP